MFNNSYNEDFPDVDMEEKKFDEVFSWDPNFDPSGFPGSVPYYACPGLNYNSRARYDNAYGNYQGGYGPGGGYGPRPFLLPPPPPTPSLRGGMRGRRLRPARPPHWQIEDRALKYLTRCGVPKDNLRNLPHDLLILIQPEHCGLCDLDLDSFTMSRTHYISKNHSKNQKKWLSKRLEARNYNEIPFKARNLYCEVCDVQITSKSHGDAHYNGKQHRGIVEGRKKPKNPLLLQSDMQQRLEQLIRREKRFLKYDVSKLDEEDIKKDIKPITTELHCDICKTVVTCSEQMTSHLNGKKHLSKEKQYILKMMKGTTEEDNEEVYEEGLGEEEEEEEVKEVKKVEKVEEVDEVVEVLEVKEVEKVELVSDDEPVEIISDDSETEAEPSDNKVQTKETEEKAE